MSSLTRKIYYSLPPGWRLLARWIVYMPQDLMASLFSGKHPMAPPRRLIFTGAGHFIRMGKLFLQDFISKKLVKPDSSVLDIGSGIGRIAIPLTSFLEKGLYEGFDIMKPGIRWCQKKISTRFPHFKFTQVSLANDLYRNSGDAAAQFVFPAANDQFDLAIATSVFTHMLPEEVTQYVEEIYRVLKKGGNAYLTFFILNENSLRQMNQGANEFNFQYDHGSYRLLDEKVKSANVAYDEKYLFGQVISPAKFKTTSIEYGTWSTLSKGNPIGFQDRVVITKL
ncbi:MAG TPA: class I SAM-dependent methyltransferase [Saprospiraceae bacterium]|nr:class I SAM-dependent methyltransferase [Saprospiraceae bacterium]